MNMYIGLFFTELQFKFCLYLLLIIQALETKIVSKSKFYMVSHSALFKNYTCTSQLTTVNICHIYNNFY